MPARLDSRFDAFVLMICACSPEPSAPDPDDDVGLDTSGEDSSSGDTTWGSDEFDLDDFDSDAETGIDTETDEGPPDCEDYEALDACKDAAREIYETCVEPCPEIVLGCTDAACRADCELERATAELSCRTVRCTEPYEMTACLQDCWLEFSSCITAPSCDVHGCQWEAGPCLSSCILCISPIELDFAYADSCELVLPEPPTPFQIPYISIELGDPMLHVDEAGTSCDERGLGGTIQDDVLQLCPATCDAFADAGLLRVVVLGPPCG